MITYLITSVRSLDIFLPPSLDVFNFFFPPFLSRASSFAEVPALCSSPFLVPVARPVRPRCWDPPSVPKIFSASLCGLTPNSPTHSAQQCLYSPHHQTPSAERRLFSLTVAISPSRWERSVGVSEDFILFWSRPSAILCSSGAHARVESPPSPRA